MSQVSKNAFQKPVRVTVSRVRHTFGGKIRARNFPRTAVLEPLLEQVVAENLLPAFGATSHVSSTLWQCARQFLANFLKTR